MTNKEVVKLTKKAGAKKTMSKNIKKKADVVDNKNDEKITPDLFFRIFYDGWKNSFNLKGRSSRLEIWCFLLVNAVLSVIIQLKCSYFLSSKFLIDANVLGYGIEKIDTYVTMAQIFYWGSVLLPLIPIFSMLVRRMHDLGKLAWYGYLEQVFMGVVVMSILMIAIDELMNVNFELLALFLSGCFVTFLYSVLYYSLKFFVVTLFYKGGDVKNEFGEARYVGKIYDEFALKVSIFYMLYIMTVGMLYLGVWYF